jgi:tRNA A-37 threonylcarbamoyl transferase component Bud32
VTVVRWTPVRPAVGVGALAPALVGDEVEAFLADPDAFMDRGETLKDDAPSRVVRLPLAGHDVVIKRFRHPDPWRALRRSLQPSRARRAAGASVMLAEAGLEVPPPLGWLEGRRGPLRTGSWWLSGFVEAREAPDVLADPALPASGRAALIDALADVVGRLQAARIAHGDLKATNLLLPASGPPVLIDLHAARRVGLLGGRRLRRDRRRFRRNFAHDPALAEAVADALARRGVPRD